MATTPRRSSAGTTPAAGSFGQLLRARRKALGLAQTDVATGAGITAQYIGMLELGVRAPSADTIDRLVIALDLDGPAASKFRKAGAH